MTTPTQQPDRALTLHIWTCRTCPFAGDAVEIDCNAPRLPGRRKPDIRAVIKSVDGDTTPPVLCPLRTQSVTVTLGDAT